eukprot:Sspe_Gene.95220::Locus_67525_Transcript_1_1_Confidence_1.000_Length_5040::g.95220::m.95220
MLWWLLWVAISAAQLRGASGGLPQCATPPRQCYFKADTHFADAYQLMFDGDTADIERDPAIHNSLCNRENWYFKEEACDTFCPLRLVVTSPPHLRMSMCAVDNRFLPFLPDGHIDETHEYNGKEFAIVPGPDPMACSDGPFLGRNLTGSIAVLMRGNCIFEKKFRNLGQAHPAIGVVVSTRVQNKLDENAVAMEGSSDGIAYPAILVPHIYGQPLLDALNRNESLRGKVELNCTARTAPMPADDYAFDGCPHPMLTRGLCDGMADDKDRLCSRCPVVLTLANSTTSVSGCLYGNMLVPRRKRNNFYSAFALPLNESVVYLGWQRAGCDPEDFTPYRGRIVAVSYDAKECISYFVAQGATEKGVKGLILMQRPGNYYPSFADGDSRGVGIPVGTVFGADRIRVVDFIVQNAVSLNGSALEISGVKLEEGVMPSRDSHPSPHPPATDPPVVAVANEEAAFRGTPAVIVCFILIAIMATALLVVLLQPRQGRTSKGIPLTFASTGLSLTLLIIITSVAFFLAYYAGRRGMDTAMSSGRRAVDDVHSSAVENIADVSNKLLGTVVSSAVKELMSILDKGHHLTLQNRRIMNGYDRTWAKFKDTYDTFIQIVQESGWKSTILTVEGFAASDDYITDSTGTPGVGETQNGFDCGVQSMTYKTDKWVSEPSGIITPRSEYDPHKMIGASFADPLQAVRKDVDFSQRWFISRYNLKRKYGYERPIVVATPMGDSAGGYLGASLSERPAESIAREIMQYQSSPLFANISLFIVESSDELVVSATVGSPYRRIDSVPFPSKYQPAFLTPTVDEVPIVEVNAASNFIRKHFGGFAVGKTALVGSGVFDQADYFRGPPSQLMRFNFDTSEPVDSSGSRWRTEIAGSCDRSSTCFGDGVHGTRGMVFDGKTALLIHRTLTTDIPRVKEAREGRGRWKSVQSVYHLTEPHPGGGDVVMYRGSDGVTRPVLRDPFHMESDFTISVWIRHGSDLDNTTYVNSASIFSDTGSGDAAVRWFSNGMLYLSHLYHGCRTKPVPGLVKGVWTHLTAVADWTARTCAVYVNGTLHHRANISVTVKLPFSPSPYFVGQYFVGTLDELEVHNRTLLGDEVRELYEAGTVQRKIPSREWYVTFGTARRGGDETQMYLTVVGLIPAADVRRNIDENNRITRENLVVEEENTWKDLDQIMTDNVFILVTVALFFMLIFLGFNHMLTTPFAIFAERMLDAAVLRVGTYSEENYIVRELNIMDQAMVIMARNLREYRNFMPQTVIPESEVKSMYDISTDTESTTTTRPTTEHTSCKSGSGSTTHTSDTSVLDVHDAFVPVSKMMTTLGLTRRKISLVVSNIRGFHRLCETLAEHDLIAAHGAIISCLLTMCNSHKGVPHPFMGDRLMCSFNTIKISSAHRIAACKYTFQAPDRVSALSGHEGRVQLSMAVGSGEAKVGNMGTEGMKQFTLLGPVVPWTFSIERHCTALQLPNLVDLPTGEAARNEFFLYHADCVTYHKRHEKRALRLSTLASHKNLVNDEWMYQLEEANRRDEFAGWNEACNALFRRDFMEARVLFERARKSSIPSTVVERMMGWLSSQRGPIELS